MPYASSNRFTSPKNFDIEETKDSTVNENIVKAGVIENWESLTIPNEAEKTKARPWITGFVLFAWIACIIVGLTKYLIAGDASLFFGSTLWLLPISIVLRFYYR